MITEKKNQHYLPKFYLRHFSYQNNKKQIGIFNLEKEYFFATAALKNQGSKNFFYGQDGKIEDALSKIETLLSDTIRSIIDTENLPLKQSDAHRCLLYFIALTDLRNPIRVNNMKDVISQMGEKLKELDQSVEISKFLPNVSHNNIIQSLLMQANELVENTTDLDYKLLTNATKTPFITSDFPIVKYNQFLEINKWKGSKTGYGTVGLQIFVPLNNKLVLLLFDSHIYKIGDKKKKYLTIDNDSDVNEINKLQFVNCFETIYFDEKATETYIRKIFEDSKKYKRANVPSVELGYILDENIVQPKNETNKENFMISGCSDCETKLNVSGIKIHQEGKSYKFDNCVVQVRAHCKSYRNYSF
jgi:hypothetical protein